MQTKQASKQNYQHIKDLERIKFLELPQTGNKTLVCFHQSLLLLPSTKKNGHQTRIEGATVSHTIAKIRRDIFNKMLSLTLSRSSRLGSSSRCLATLVANEEFPLAVSISPKTKTSPVVKESTLSNGIKIISSDSGASVRYPFVCLIVLKIVLWIYSHLSFFVNIDVR